MLLSLPTGSMVPPFTMKRVSVSIFGAVLKKEYNQKTKQYSYSAFGYWFLHENKAFDKSDLLGNYVVNIKTLEDKTGIDFFCNLPDDIEKKVETQDVEAIRNLWGFKSSK